MRNKNFCSIVQEYYPRDFRVKRVSESLSKRGFRVDVIALRNSYESPYEVVNGVRVYRVNLTKKRGGIKRYIYEYIVFTLLSSFWCVRLYLKNFYKIII